jgi:hypothetical protein
MKLFALEIARTICVDPVMAALPMISVAGACLGNAAWAQMSADYLAPPNIWSAVAARSGERKSPVLTAIMRPIYERQTELAEQHATTVAQYESAIRLWKKLPKRDRGDEPIEPPPFPHLYVADATTEAIAMRLQDQPRGLVVPLDELAALFGGMNQYRAGRGHDNETYLAFYDAGPAKIDRKTAKPTTIFIPRAFVAVTGMIQPAVLARVLRPAEFDSGMAARFLLAAPEPIRARWTGEGIPDGMRNAWRDGLHALLAIPLLKKPNLISPSPEAMRRYAVAYDRLEAERHAEPNDRMRAALAKLIGAIPRIALILEAMAVVPDRRSLRNISDHAMHSAIEIVHWCGHETRRVYGMLATGSREDDVLALIYARGGIITPRELQAASRTFRGPGAATRLLDSLVQAGLGTWAWVQPPHGGRPSQVFRLSTRCRASETP